jgi:Zn-dependent alcohol dehydrogenase
MKIQAAVLDTMGVEVPYAKSKPLSIEDVELDDPARSAILLLERSTLDPTSSGATASTT